jgi:hypothetical protein
MRRGPLPKRHQGISGVWRSTQLSSGPGRCGSAAAQSLALDRYADTSSMSDVTNPATRLRLTLAAASVVVVSVATSLGRAQPLVQADPAPPA